MDQIIELAKNHSKDPEKFIMEAVKEKIRLGEKTSYPENFCITQEMQEWFIEQKFSFDIMQATDEWSYSMTNNRRKYRYSNWTRAWQNGMKKYEGWSKNGSKRNQTAYQEFKSQQPSIIETAKRIRQVRAASNDPRTHSQLNRKNLGQNGGHSRSILDNPVGHHQ